VRAADQSRCSPARTRPRDLYLLTVDLDGRAPVLRDRVTAEPVESLPDVATAIELLLAARRG
jgi:hypothetical protein